MSTQFFCIRPGPAFQKSHGRWKRVTLPKTVCGSARAGTVSGSWGIMGAAIIRVKGKVYGVRPGEVFSPGRKKHR